LQTKTELHTHLMGMLSAKGFIKFLADYNYSFPIDQNGKLDFESDRVNREPAKDLLYDKNIIEQLSISHHSKSNYSKLNDYYLNRTTLLADLIEQLVKNLGISENKDNLKNIIYGMYLEHCLGELISQDVEYVEISFSNAKIIENCIRYVDPRIFDRIKCSFLLSTDRSKVSKDFNQSSRYMANLIDKGLSVGFDVMGSELPLSTLDMDRTSKFGLEQKLTPVIQKLHAFKHTTLRVHSGETRGSNENTEKVLTVIERIADSLNIVIPPPQIRIGHGVYFNNTKEYLRLLKKFNCIIEINASSNYALDNIDSYVDIPYNYYLDNDIPVVICSDGHGVYDTTKEMEDIIAEVHVRERNKKKIVDLDKKIRKAK